MNNVPVIEQPVQRTMPSMIEAMAIYGQAHYPAGSLLPWPLESGEGVAMAPPGARTRLALALRWMVADAYRTGSGGTLGSLMQTSAALWMDRNGMSEKTMTQLVRDGFELSKAELQAFFAQRAEESGVAVESVEKDFLKTLTVKAKHWQARRNKGIPDWHRCLPVDNVLGEQNHRTAQLMKTAQGQADLLARYFLKVVGTGLTLGFNDLSSLKQPVIRALDRHALDPDLTTAAKAAWLQRQVKRWLGNACEHRDRVSDQCQRQLGVFNPWRITDDADIAVARTLWDSLQVASAPEVGLPLRLDDVWRLSHAVLRDLTDPMLVEQGFWSDHELHRLEACTVWERDRRQVRDGKDRALLKPLRKLIHDHVQWVQRILEAQ